MDSTSSIEKAGKNDSLLIDAAQLAGLLILESGGETFRAEETVVNFCLAGGCDSASAIAYPTGILMSVSLGSETYSSVKRITRRGNDLVKLSRANDITRRFVKGQLTLENAYEELKEVSRAPGPSRLLKVLCSAATAAFFAVLFGGNLFDGAVAFVAGLLIQLVAFCFRHTGIYNFAVSFIGGAVIALLAVLGVTAFKMGSIEHIIIGATMPLLPGLMLTSAIRDAVMGDLMAGATRLVEALLVAVAIASGVGIVLSAYISMGGVL